MHLVIATRNRHKLDELRALLDVPGLLLSCVDDFPCIPDVVEDGDTLEANAVKKAAAVARATRRWALADDSGLEVFALGGAPGVHSAHYAGHPPDYAANNRKLLSELNGVSDRRARFRTVIALASPSGRTRIVEGICEGAITHEPRGCAGFGYDPLFVPNGFNLTFAEMEPEQKNRISHRARAIEKARDEWRAIFEDDLPDWP